MPKAGASSETEEPFTVQTESTMSHFEVIEGEIVSCLEP
jgi:hypothetical protein